MYPYLIKLTILLTVLLGCFLLPTISSANAGVSDIAASSSSEMLGESGAHIERVLSYGMHGSDIRDLQRELRSLPTVYPSGKVTGYFGSATLAAIRRFQFEEEKKDKSVLKTTAQGVVDAPTLLTLRLRAIEKKCPQDMRSREICLEGQYKHYVSSVGVDSTLRLLQLHISNEPRFEGECHQVMHRVAHAAVHEFKNFGVAIYHGTPSCQNGYYHGVVEEFLRNENVDALTPAQLRNFCNSTLATTSTATDVLNCVHGLGHALMYMTRNDLPKSLMRCGDMQEDNMRSQCLTGVFMQESFIATSTNKSDLDKKILECTQVSGFQDVCWIILAAKEIHNKTSSTNTLDQFCATFENLSDRNACNGT